jgi:hypothetical protein
LRVHRLELLALKGVDLSLAFLGHSTVSLSLGEDGADSSITHLDRKSVGAS